MFVTVFMNAAAMHIVDNTTSKKWVCDMDKYKDLVRIVDSVKNHY